MSNLVERLRSTGQERQRTTAHDDPKHYLHVVAKISQADGKLMNEAADEIERLTAALAATERDNTHLRSALAVSKDPCRYCQLPAEEMAKCRSGFPGCDRADDMMGCPELGASLALQDAEIQAWNAAIEAALHNFRYGPRTEVCGMSVLSLSSVIDRISALRKETP